MTSPRLSVLLTDEERRERTNAKARRLRDRNRTKQHDPNAVYHGTVGGYSNHCCRCDRCREAYNDFSREWRARPGVAERRRELARIASRKPERRLAIKARQYGIDRETLRENFRVGRCFACDREVGAERLEIDHDHSCCPISRKVCGDCVRGLLCSECNRVLGLVKDDPQRLMGLISYLERWAARASK